MDDRKAPNFAGMVFAEDLNRSIAVFHKKNESKTDAIERVKRKHSLSKEEQNGDKSGET